MDTPASYSVSEKIQKHLPETMCASKWQCECSVVVTGALPHQLSPICVQRCVACAKVPQVDATHSSFAFLLILLKRPQMRTVLPKFSAFEKPQFGWMDIGILLCSWPQDFLLWKSDDSILLYGLEASITFQLLFGIWLLGF